MARLLKVGGGHGSSSTPSSIMAESLRRGDESNEERILIMDQNKCKPVMKRSPRVRARTCRVGWVLTEERAHWSPPNSPTHTHTSPELGGVRLPQALLQGWYQVRPPQDRWLFVTLSVLLCTEWLREVMHQCDRHSALRKLQVTASRPQTLASRSTVESGRRGVGMPLLNQHAKPHSPLPRKSRSRRTCAPCV